jgi:hypothetical protein
MDTIVVEEIYTDNDNDIMLLIHELHKFIRKAKRDRERIVVLVAVEEVEVWKGEKKC